MTEVTQQAQELRDIQKKKGREKGKERRKEDGRKEGRNNGGEKTPENINCVHEYCCLSDTMTGTLI